MGERHPEGEGADPVSQDEAFVREIVSKPGDDLPRLVYADYLDERNDPRGAYLRAEVEWAKTRQTAGFLVLRLHGLAEALDPVWVARVSRPPEGVCCDHLGFTECGPRLTADEVAAVAGRLGVAFPPEFVAFLLNYNAGQVTPVGTAPEQTPYAVSDDIEWGFYPIGHEFDMVHDIERTHRANGNDLPPPQAAVMNQLVPLARANDEDLFFLGVAGSRTGKVYYFNGYDFDWFNPNGLSERADSFPRFLAALTARWVHA